MRAAVAGVVAATLLAVPLPATALPDDDHLTVWESGGIGEPTMAAARLTAAITGGSVTVIHEGTVRMMSVTREGGPVQQPDPGFGYPMALTAVPVAQADVIDAELPVALARGIVMGRRAAALRGAEVGDRVVLEGWDGGMVQVGISRLVADDRIGWAEIVVSSAVADTLAFDRPSTVVLRGVEPERAAEVFEGLAPDRPIRVGSRRRPITFSDPTLPAVVLKERFGEFSFRPTGVGDGIQIDQDWLDDNIVTVDLPVLGVFRCNRAAVPYIRGAIAEMEASGAISGIDPQDFQLAGGCFNSRLMRGGDKGFALSRHAWGAAIDFNPSTNRYGEEVTLDPEIGEIMRGWGFSWGATWTVPDGMHFEWTHIPQVKEACSGVELQPPHRQQVAWQVLPSDEPCDTHPAGAGGVLGTG